MFFGCQNINKAYPNSTFKLINISFEADKGDIIGLIGENGSGKTTLMNALSNIYPRDSGYVYYKDGEADDDFYRNRLGYLTDQFNLYEYLTIQENIDFVAKVRRLDIKEIEIGDLLENFNLLEYRFTEVKNLSKGMRQKFNFIINILHKPQVLLLDEPFDGLDPQQIRKMEEVILKLASEGVCILLSSHILDFIDKLCNKVIYIKEGVLSLYIDNLNNITKENLEQLFYETKDI
ncbi:ABC transporter ATP-binding protein [Streptococcus ferus]|uniref:ABC transporter ATP-binding protein n=1 Tax=Streptococcus ferus TaxID=1345 RepID=UPI0023529AE7|nr:ABC transporter ATP-binding protein [Streptococcus ferus]